MSSKFIFNGNGLNENNSQANDMNKKYSNSQEEFLDPQELFSLFRRNIWIILLCIVLSVSGTYYFLDNYLSPVYQSSGTILISTNESTLPASGGQREESGVGNIIARSFSTSFGNPVQSAIYLIESREFAQNVAERIIDLQKSGSARQFPTLWTEYPADSSLTSPERVTSRINRALSVEQVEPTSNRLGSNMLEISYESFSPQEAAVIVNLSLTAFQEKTLEMKQNAASKALSFLEEKKEETRIQLNQAEDNLVSFKNENQLVAIDAQADNSVNSLSQLQAEKQNLEIQLESINSSIQNYEKQMEAIKPGMADQYSKAIGPTIAKYQQRLAELRTRRFVLLSNNPQLKENPNSEPELKKLNQQISELENEIQSLSDDYIRDNEGYLEMSTSGDGNLAEELANIRRNLIQLRIEKNQHESQIQVLNQRIKEARSFLDTFPDKQVKLARLETEVQRHKQLLNNIISQESEVALWQQIQTSSGSIVDQATPSYSPVKPNKVLWLSFSGLMGFILPVGFLFIRNTLSTVIKGSEKLKKYPYPLLSVVYDHSLVKTSGWFLNRNKDIEKSKLSENLVFYHYNDSPIAESYRKIVNQIVYNNPDTSTDSILVTSSGQGEGKTTLTGNLGTAFTEIDKKVLIIDCDFRRPAMHKLFSLGNTLGINEVLSKGAKLSDAIKETEISGLYLLPTGSKPDSPAKLLASDKFKEMIKVVRPNYDLILFDTPPHGLVSDVASLLNLTDLVIVTSMFGKTKENVLKHTLEELDKNEEAKLSLVLTGYKPGSSHDTYDTKVLHEYMYQQYYEYEKINEN